MESRQIRTLPRFPIARADHLRTPPALTARGISLRPAGDADLAYLGELYASIRAGDVAHAPWPQAAKRVFLRDQFHQQHRHYLTYYGDADFLLIECDGTPIGRYYLQRAHPDYVIVDISLDAGARAHGVASALIEATQANARLHGCGVVLDIGHQNLAARRLYERHGFVPAAGEPDAPLRLRWASPAAETGA